MRLTSAASELIENAVAAGTLPGGVLVTGQRSETTGLHVAGTLCTGGERITAGTVFDLASLTKVVATLPCVLSLVDQGLLGLDDPVIRYVPAFGGGPRSGVTIRQLLSHTSGLPDGYPFYRIDADPATRWQAVPLVPLIAAPGSAMCYSDIGFMLLGLIVEEITSVGLDDAAHALVFAPLDMTATRFRPPAEWLPHCAATERDAAGIAKSGVVHDENAESLGGVAGHAGLFSTGPDLARYMASWTDPDAAIITARTRREALRCQTDDLPARRGLGWTLRGDRWDHMGTTWSVAGAGHTGFTGTSLALDPDSGGWVVFLTNEVHLGREGRTIVALRRAVHDALTCG
jgi:CubicO group peptidase (beta-lactamase class C family)